HGAVGYVDCSDAKASNLAFASIKNKSGKYIEPSLDAATAALDGATVNDDLSLDALDTAGADAYPITTPTYVIVYTKQTDAKKRAALVAYLRFVLTDFQSQAADAGYAKLSDAITSKAITQLDSISAG